MNVQDFVVPVPTVERQRRGPIDLYGVDRGGRRRPAALLVHGGPVAPDADPPPRDQPGFVAYASLLADRGVVGVTFDHRLHDADHATLAADDVAAAVAATRGHEGVDPDRIGLWFPMGGVLAASWLRDPPPWLTAVAWNYPILAPGPDWDGDVPRFDCIDAVTFAPSLPKLLVRVEHELDGDLFAPAQDRFIAAARAHDVALDVLEVPGAHHPFELRDHTDDTRSAVTTAIARMVDAVAVHQ